MRLRHTKLNRHQRGYALPMTVILLALCSLMIAPLLHFMGSGLTSASIQHEKANQMYAADAGIKQGIWEITSGAVPQTVDFTRTYPAFSENSQSVAVRIDYQWILSGIADATFGPHNQWMDVTTTGNPDITGIYTIAFVYDLASNPGNKLVEDMGVWLPFGYSYVPGSAAEFADNMTLAEPGLTSIHGGTSVKWTDVNYSFKTTGLTPTQRFRFTPVGKLPRGDVAWVQSQSSDIGLSWDRMIWNYKISSTALNIASGKQTTIVAHVSSDSGATSGLAIITYTIDPPGI